MNAIAQTGPREQLLIMKLPVRHESCKSNRVSLTLLMSPIDKHQSPAVVHFKKFVNVLTRGSTPPPQSQQIITTCSLRCFQFNTYVKLSHPACGVVVKPWLVKRQSTGCGPTNDKAKVALTPVYQRSALCTTASGLPSPNGTPRTGVVHGVAPTSLGNLNSSRPYLLKRTAMNLPTRVEQFPHLRLLLALHAIELELHLL